MPPTPSQVQRDFKSSGKIGLNARSALTASEKPINLYFSASFYISPAVQWPKLNFFSVITQGKKHCFLFGILGRPQI